MILMKREREGLTVGLCKIGGGGRETGLLSALYQIKLCPFLNSKNTWNLSSSSAKTTHEHCTKT
uniref:Uncharacterized protein n=1 Tax=Anguilla anguilla TaxID=7936 RepID=A0A0E9X727_ANGAN